MSQPISVQDTVNPRWRSDKGEDGGDEMLMADGCMGTRWACVALTVHHGKKNEGKNKKSDAKT